MEIETEKVDLTLDGIEQFTGTTRYYNVLSANVTDGIKYVMDNGYSWFITDALIVIKMKLRNEEFLSIKLKLADKDKGKMVITDGNEKTLYTQEYKYTDAKRELSLYFTDNVMMLSSEY